MKTVLSVVAVEPRCRLISVPSVNTSQVSTKIRITVKSAEYAGEYILHAQFDFVDPDVLVSDCSVCFVRATVFEGEY